MEKLNTGIKRFEINQNGRDFAVGDIHGAFTYLQQTLDHLGFEPKCDRLFSVGDLVDRGPESELALEWLAKPWFHAIQGNHEIMCILGAQGNPSYFTNHVLYGGDWLYVLPQERQDEFCEAFMQLPLMIEVQTTRGLVALSHADYPFHDWLEMDRENFSKAEINYCQWSRERCDQRNKTPIQNIRAMVHGHTPMMEMQILGNCFYIDTGAWMVNQGGYFTLLDLATLEPLTIFSHGPEED